MGTQTGAWKEGGKGKKWIMIEVSCSRNSFSDFFDPFPAVLEVLVLTLSTFIFWPLLTCR